MLFVIFDLIFFVCKKTFVLKFALIFKVVWFEISSDFRHFSNKSTKLNIFSTFIVCAICYVNFSEFEYLMLIAL